MLLTEISTIAVRSSRCPQIHRSPSATSVRKSRRAGRSPWKSRRISSNVPATAHTGSAWAVNRSGVIVGFSGQQGPNRALRRHVG
ncbi:hypothetical protein ADK67_02730 [Saccharothrix sp. NRRL B-16348]|uniref:hypothetical protein n=1 Tax=Saccharothrix sp. NRRL B-16348 TaxID=1415542 RepID=UPI0006B04EEE|nr:hypothetical protein [Saccharothrix sp. NRRL B-16348]KOX34833.1 hypothetical protein ADK67_02730 [Saccharothrix sp. NRRL B-16348]